MKIAKHKIIQSLFERDGDKCGICGQPLPWDEYKKWRKESGARNGTPKTKKRLEIDLDVDHKIQKRFLKGHIWAYLCNLQLTHKQCNNKKG